MWEKILRAIVGAPEVDEPGLGDITDLQNGRDLKVIKRLVKSGADAYPNYTESKFMNPSVAGTEAEIKNWMANRHDLASLITVKPFEELAKEVRIHRGLEKDPEIAVDAPISKPHVQEISRPVAPMPPIKSKPPADDDEPVDDEFFQKLRNL